MSSNGDQVGEVDQRLQAEKFAGKQLVHRDDTRGGLLFDDRHRQRMLRAEVEIHCALGQFGLGEDVVEADVVVSPSSELM